MDQEIDYKVYKMSLPEKIKYFMVITSILLIFSYLFFNSLIIGFIFFIPLKLYYKLISNYLNEKRREKLTNEFREFCTSMCTQLIAGYALENAINEVNTEMDQLFSDKSYISKELVIMRKKLIVGEKIEKCFEEFANRCDIEEIRLFAEILKIAKRSGGDIIEIIKNSSDTIGQRLEVEREIRIIINSKKYEQLIMNFIPLLMILYVKFTSPEMMNIMYETIIGRIIMIICLIVYLLAIFIGKKLTNIKI